MLALIPKILSLKYMHHKVEVKLLSAVATRPVPQSRRPVAIYRHIPLHKDAGLVCAVLA
jgi:hypothetical protein